MRIFKMSIFFVLLILSFSYATRETIIQVIQPNIIEEGIEYSTSTYIYFIGFPIGYSVRLTCEANSIVTQSGTANRNIASIFGLDVELKYDTYDLISDTLETILIIPDTIQVPPKYKHISVEEVVNSTIKCLILNAASYDRLKYLDLKISGNSKYSKLSKILNIRR